MAGWCRVLLPILGSLAALVLVTRVAAAQGAAGTGIAVTVSSQSRLTSTYQWTLSDAASPSSQLIPVGSSTTVAYTITVSKSASGQIAGMITGTVCVTNAGNLPTQGLAIQAQVSAPPSKTALSQGSVDTSAQPALAPGATHCYPATLALPAEAIHPGATYKTTAAVTITNHSGHLGTPFGPSPSAATTLPTTPTIINPTITVSDTNGQQFTFGSSGSQSYDQGVACPVAAGPETITQDTVAAITETGQTASAEAIVHCGVPVTISTSLAQQRIVPGSGDTDQATISGATAASAGGSITYTVYTDNACHNIYADATPANNAVAAGSVPASAAISFPTAGTYWWVASYSGDATSNTLGSSSLCNAEPMTVFAWQDGDLTTFDQVQWADGTGLGGPPAILQNNFDAVYLSTSDVFQIGLPGPGYSLAFGDADHLQNFLPASGAPAALTSSQSNPTSSEAGIFAGDVAALKLNIDFSAAGPIRGTSGIPFGSLTVCNLTADTDLNGLTVAQVLALENTALGGGATTDSIADLDTVAAELDGSFQAGTPTTFAQKHLARDSSCQAVNWQNGDVITYDQVQWAQGYITEAPPSILLDNFDTVYLSTSDIFQVGLPSPGYSLAFGDGDHLLSFLPADGAPAALSESQANPGSSEAGIFGGDVIALKLNVDFADAGLLPTSLGLKFGDLTLCNLSQNTDLNGLTVRQVLAIENTALGGGTTTDSVDDLDDIAQQLNVSFERGEPQPFAQEHLVNGPCM